MANLNSLMLGGYEIDVDFEIASDQDLYIEEMKNKAMEMSDDELNKCFANAIFDSDKMLEEVYGQEIFNRSLAAIDDVAFDDEFDDCRKDYLENYAADKLPL